MAQSVLHKAMRKIFTNEYWWDFEANMHWRWRGWSEHNVYRWNNQLRVAENKSSM